tara:strand:+ start:911 stop:3559 length:2649 start_codon:yes stop_codon:yes gene_type:complete
MILKDQPIALKLKNLFNFLNFKIHKILKIVFLILALGFAYILGDEHGSHSKNVELKYKILRIYQFFKSISYDYFSINTNNQFDTYTLNINFEEFSKLQKMRDSAVKAKIILPEHKKKVKGKIQLNNENEKIVNLRLRGFETSHVDDPKKWSFRINITNNNKSSYNQKYKKFSLMHASRRFFIYEWIYHQALKDNGILSPDYEFVKLILNGDNLGIYAMEQHYDGVFLELNQRRDGPLFKINDDEHLFKFKSITDNNDNELLENYIYGYFLKTDFWKSNLEPIGNLKIDDLSKTKSDKSLLLLNQFDYVQKKYNEFVYNVDKSAEIFDLDLFAKFYAISLIFGANHATSYEDLRYYFNPISKKIEPIGSDGYDSDSDWDKKNNYFYFMNTGFVDDPIKIKLFNNQEFVTKFNYYLNDFLKTDYLNKFLKKNEKEINERLKLIYSEFPLFYFNSSLLEKHKSMLETLFSLNDSSLITNFQILPDDDLSDLNKISLRLENLSEIVAIKPLGLKYNEKVHYFKNLDVIALPNSPGQRKKYTYMDTGLDFKNFFNGRTIEFENLYLIFSSIDNKEKEFYSKVQPRYFKSYKKKKNQIVVNNNNDFLSFKEKSIKLNTDLIIPKNKKLLIYPGQEIILDNSSIISYGTLIFNGTEKNPIKIYSPKNNKSGIVILNSKKENKFKFVKFENLSSKISEDYLTGAITVYKSKVLFQNCIFDKTHSEDFLNLISSKFIIQDTLFKNSKFDMLDSDFSSGEIINSSFFYSGNDAIDFSGSDVNLKNLVINNTGDKAISIGENSKLSIENIKIEQSLSGIAVKDESNVIISNTSINNSKNGLSSYIKKKNYKNSKINLENVTFNNNLYDIVNSDFSKIYFNGKVLDHNVKKITY